MHTYTHTYIHTHIHTYAHKHAFKALTDIEAGQELFVSYGGEKWFKNKGLPLTVVDYGSTMWRPELKPLPCCLDIQQATEDNGTRTYTSLAAIPANTVVDVSLCLDVPASFIKDFPSLRDSVLPGQTEHVHVAHQ